jgi:hypothetical protein
LNVLVFLGHLFDATQRVYGVTPNIFHATIQGFLNVDSSIFDDLDNFDYRDLPKQLYTAEGNILNNLKRKILCEE